MKNKVKFLFYSFSFFIFSQINAMSFVYSLKKPTRIFNFTKPKSLSTNIFLIDEFGPTHEKVNINSFGTMLDLVYQSNNNFIRLNSALANITAKDEKMGKKQSRTQLDDLYLSAIFHKKLSTHTGLFLHGIFVIPTHNNTLLTEIQFGEACFSIGSQLSIFHSLEIESLKLVILGIFRHLFFIPRTLEITDEQDFIIKKFDFERGNLVDLLLAIQFEWKTHNVEIGYNPQFLFGVSIDPNVKLVVKALDFIRGGYYATYTNSFKIKKFDSNIILGVSYDPFYKPKKVSYKYTASGWIAFHIRF